MQYSANLLFSNLFAIIQNKINTLHSKQLLNIYFRSDKQVEFIIAVFANVLRSTDDLRRRRFHTHSVNIFHSSSTRMFCRNSSRSGIIVDHQ